MTLDIRTHLIENGTELWVEDKEWGGKKLEGITFVMGMCTISIGMPHLTAANKGEFLRRIRVMEEIHGPLMNQGPTPVLFTEEDIERRIGLRTNATEYSKAKFAKIMMVQHERAEREREIAERYAAKQEAKALAAAAAKSPEKVSS